MEKRIKALSLSRRSIPWPPPMKLEFDPYPWYLITWASYLSMNWNSDCDGKNQPVSSLGQSPLPRPPLIILLSLTVGIYVYIHIQNGYCYSSHYADIPCNDSITFCRILRNCASSYEAIAIVVQIDTALCRVKVILKSLFYIPFYVSYWIFTHVVCVTV